MSLKKELDELGLGYEEVIRLKEKVQVHEARIEKMRGMLQEALGPGVSVKLPENMLSHVIKDRERLSNENRLLLAVLAAARYAYAHMPTRALKIRPVLLLALSAYDKESKG